MDAQLEIESIMDYYDAPINGVARLGDQRLYYTWVDDQMAGQFKVRLYCAYELADEEWALLEHWKQSDEDAVLPNGEDADRAAVEQADEAARAVGVLHTSLESREGVVGFTSSSLPFPCYS